MRIQTRLDRVFRSSLLITFVTWNLAFVLGFVFGLLGALFNPEVDAAKNIFPGFLLLLYMYVLGLFIFVWFIFPQALLAAIIIELVFFYKKPEWRYSYWYFIVCGLLGALIGLGFYLLISIWTNSDIVRVVSKNWTCIMAGGLATLWVGIRLVSKAGPEELGYSE